MKLNSKLPMVIVIATMAIFLSISTNYNTIKINSVDGDINELSDINIKVENYGESNYIDYTYTLNKEDTKRESKLKKTQSDDFNKDIQLIDTTNKNNLVANIGYETHYSKPSSKVNLVIDTYKDEEYKEDISKSSELNKIILSDDIDKKNVQRKIIEDVSPIKNDNKRVELLATYNYNNETYIFTNHYGDTSKDREEILEVSKINNTNDNIESVKLIDLHKEINGYKRMNIVDIHAKGSNIYMVISTGKHSVIDEAEDDVYILSYGIETKNVEVNQIDMPEDNYVVASVLEDNKINLVTTKNENRSNEIENIEIISFEYDINDKNVNNLFRVEIPRDKSSYKYIKEVLIDNNKIHVLTNNNGNLDVLHPKLNTYIYTINKDMEQISFAGALNKEMRYSETYLELADKDKN